MRLLSRFRGFGTLGLVGRSLRGGPEVPFGDAPVGTGVATGVVVF